MQRRDEDIQSAADAFQRLKVEHAAKKLSRQEKEEFLEQEKVVNADLDKRIEAAQRQVGSPASCPAYPPPGMFPPVNVRALAIDRRSDVGLYLPRYRAQSIC